MLVFVYNALIYNLYAYVSLASRKIAKVFFVPPFVFEFVTIICVQYCCVHTNFSCDSGFYFLLYAPMCVYTGFLVVFWLSVRLALHNLANNINHAFFSSFLHLTKSTLVIKLEYFFWNLCHRSCFFKLWITGNLNVYIDNRLQNSFHIDHIRLVYIICKYADSF